MVASAVDRNVDVVVGRSGELRIGIVIGELLTDAIEARRRNSIVRETVANRARTRRIGSSAGWVKDIDGAKNTVLLIHSGHGRNNVVAFRDMGALVRGHEPGAVAFDGSPERPTVLMLDVERLGAVGRSKEVACIKG